MTEENSPVVAAPGVAETNAPAAAVESPASAPEVVKPPFSPATDTITNAAEAAIVANYLAQVEADTAKAAARSAVLLAKAVSDKAAADLAKALADQEAAIHADQETHIARAAAYVPPHKRPGYCE